jgi:hypothetical protein
MRVRFKGNGQRKFLDMIVSRLNSPSIRGLLQFGFNLPYSTLKNYYNQSRLLPESLFIDMCELANFDRSSLKFDLVDDNWGRVKGGRIGKRG